MLANVGLHVALGRHTACHLFIVDMASRRREVDQRSAVKLQAARRNEAVLLSTQRYL